MNSIEVINNTDDPLPESGIVLFLEKLLTRLAVTNWDLPVSFVSSEAIHQLNAEYRKSDRPTDVITFNAFENGLIPDFEVVSPGDIVISMNEVRENSKEHGVSLTEELQRILIHSVLHLLGETHESYDFKTDPMLIRQESLLMELRKEGDSQWAF